MDTLPSAVPPTNAPDATDVSAPSAPLTGDLGPAGSAGTSGLDSSTDNGQTGSLAPQFGCLVDADCAPRAESWTEPDFEYQLLDSSCEYDARDGERGPAPSCVCKMAVTGPFLDPDVFEVPKPYVRQTQERVFVLGDDARQESWRGQPRCLLEAERPAPYQCNYWDFEFPGCDIERSDGACDMICQDAVSRLRTQTQIPHELEIRQAECRTFRVGEHDEKQCVTAVRVDDQCYNLGWTPVSCALSDEEIAQSRSLPPPLEQPPLVPCSVAEDCPRGLGCDGSHCGPCLGPPELGYTSHDMLPRETVDFPCGKGEVCSYGTCLSAQLAECQNDDVCWLDSEPWRPCVNTGLDNLSVRGNEHTRSYCVSEQPNVWGLEPGDLLQATPLGPSVEVDAAFQPSPYPYPGLGCTELVSETLTFRIGPVLPGSGDHTQLVPLDATPPAPADHPRDLPEGRQLYSDAGYNYLRMDQQGRGPYILRGCSGQARFAFDILSEKRDPARARAADGSFPTTVLEFDFSADDPADPSCVGLEARWCTQHVELKRLTP